MSKKKCLICTNRTSTAGLSFHNFPKDVNLFNLWIEAIGKENYVVKSNSILCSTHFKPECLDKRIDRVKLKKGSVPTVFPGKSRTDIDESSDNDTIANSVFETKETGEITVEQHCSYIESPEKQVQHIQYDICKPECSDRRIDHVKLEKGSVPTVFSGQSRTDIINESSDNDTIANSVFETKETGEITVEPHCSYIESSEMQVQHIQSRGTQNEICSILSWQVKHDHEYTYTLKTQKKKLVDAYKKIFQFRKSTRYLKQEVNRLRKKVTSLKDVIGKLEKLNLVSQEALFSLSAFQDVPLHLFSRVKKNARRGKILKQEYPQ